MTDPRPAELISAVPTPFDTHGEIDEHEFEALIERLKPYVDAAFVAGTTGEFPALTDDERVRLFAIAARVLGPNRVIAHVGGTGGVRTAVSLIDTAKALGISRFAAIEPMFFAVDDRTTVDYYARLGAHVGAEGKMFAYLFPERSGNDTSLHALTEILALDGIAGVKLSGGANRHLDNLLSAAIAGKIYTGDDSKFPDIIAAGGAGIVSGCSAAFPEEFAILRDAISSADNDAIAAAQRQAREAIELVGASILWLKAYLAATTGSEWASRMAMPLMPTDREQTILHAANLTPARRH